MKNEEIIKKCDKILKKVDKRDKEINQLMADRHKPGELAKEYPHSKVPTWL